MAMLHNTGAKQETTLIIRSLLPSVGSLIGCALGAMLLVGGHVLAIALQGGGLPFTDQNNDFVLQFFTSYVINPAQAALHNSWLNTGLLLVLWGLFAWILFESAALLISNITAWKDARHQVLLPGGTEATPRQHPLEKEYLKHVAWRGCVMFVATASTLLLVPVLRYTLTHEAQLFQSASAVHASMQLAQDMAVWLLILHWYVVVLRWYMFRTRVFGEIIY